MKNYFLLSFFCLLFIGISCGDSDPDTMEEEEEEEVEGPACTYADDRSLEVVTGVEFFDVNGAPIGQVGNPNVTTDPPVTVYPNPSDGNIFISKSNDVFYTFYLFPCEKDTMCMDTNFDDYSYEYTENALAALDGPIFGLETQNLQTEISPEFEAGYYKLVFHAAGEPTIVHNMYIDSDRSPNEIIEFLNGEF